MNVDYAIILGPYIRYHSCFAEPGSRNYYKQLQQFFEADIRGQLVIMPSYTHSYMVLIFYTAASTDIKRRIYTSNYSV